MCFNAHEGLEVEGKGEWVDFLFWLWELRAKHLEGTKHKEKVVEPRYQGFIFLGYILRSILRWVHFPDSG